jgi:NADH-quinone oxidoreductase subunit L
MVSEYSIVWLIPAFPLLGFLINGFVGARMPKIFASMVACSAMALSFVVAVRIFLMVQADPARHIVTLLPWMSTPAFGGIPAVTVNWEALVDPLTCLMLLIITGVGGLIHFYSTGYMAADKGLPRFFTYLNLFIVFMLLLVMGNNMLMMFIGWEGVGLCSYLLIGYFYDKPSAAAAALKAMVVNRVGDVGVLIAMFLSLKWFGTLDFYRGAAGVPGILDQAASLAGTALISSPAIAAGISLICLMVFWGCTGKSAQLPLYTWLPDAMEGPTPVSALIHAATMVTAGVYLVSRMHALFELSDLAMAVVAIVGIATAFFAASMGLVQNDIKRILAYSTMSQLGYMFAACGVGAFAAGMFHVMTHAFFKACLFLGSGVVIHAMEHAIHERNAADLGHGQAHSSATPAGPGPDPDDPQDVRNMGGLARRLPKTHLSMLVATAAISGIVLFSGFFSKDEILSQAAGSRYPLIWLVGVVTAAMTAFYMMRLMYKAFYGSPKTEEAKHAHETGWAMIGTVAILGVLSVVGGYVAIPADWLPGVAPLHSLFGFLAPATGTLPDRPGLLPEPVLLGISIAVAFVFVGLAYFVYKGRDGRDLIPAQSKPTNFVYQLLLHKYWVDEIYYAIFTVGGRAISNQVYLFLDLKVVDGIVNGVGWLTGQIGSAVRALQTGYVRNYAFSMMVGVIFVLIACYLGYRHMGLH